MQYKIAALVAALALSGCATNMATVGAFGKSTQDLASQSTDMLSKYSQQCVTRLAIVDHEKSILTNAQIYWQAQSKSAPQSSDTIKQAQGHLATLDQAFNDLKPYDTGLRKYCPHETNQLKAAMSVGEVLNHYAGGLQALASDSFVAYDPKLDDIPASVAKLPGAGNDPLLTDAQVGAVQSLVDLVYKMAIESYRQKQLVKAMGPDQKTQLFNVADTLSHLATSYSQSLITEKLELTQFSSDVEALLVRGALPEPLAVDSIQRDVKNQGDSLDNQQETIKAYITALGNMKSSFDKAADSINHPDRKDIAKEVIDFGKSVHKVQQNFNNAF